MKIHDIKLPGARFKDAAALQDHRAAAQAYEAAVAAYAAGGYPQDLSDALGLLGFDYKEIEWHIHRPGHRLPQGYGSAETTTK